MNTPNIRMLAIHTSERYPYIEASMDGPSCNVWICLYAPLKIVMQHPLVKCSIRQFFFPSFCVNSTMSLRCSIETHSIWADFCSFPTLDRLGTIGSIVFFIFRLAIKIYNLIDRMLPGKFCKH